MTQLNKLLHKPITQLKKPTVRCGVDHRLSWDLARLWLWRRPAAVAPISPLAWELPNAEGAALKKKKKKKNPKTKPKKRPLLLSLKAQLWPSRINSSLHSPQSRLHLKLLLFLFPYFKFFFFCLFSFFRATTAA